VADDQSQHVHRFDIYPPQPGALYRHYGYDDPLGIDTVTRVRAMEAALVTPLDSNAMRVRLEATPVAQNAAEIRVAIASQSLRLDRAVGDALAGTVDVLFAFYHANGERLKAGSRNEVRLRTSAKKLEEFRNKDVVVQQKLSVPAEAASGRVVVRDVGTGVMGSATFRLR
jgi:hypothetical protein